MTKKTLMVFLLFILAGCMQSPRIPQYPNQNSVYKEPTTPAGGVGLESQDIISAADKMARDILASAAIIKHPTPPRIVIDSKYLRNRSSSRIDTNALTNKLRVELMRAANGRVVFLARHLADMTETEWMLEEGGVVSEGTQGETKRALGYDYRLGGQIVSIDAEDPKTSVLSRYHQITFELVERGSSVIVWSGIYEFKK